MIPVLHTERLTLRPPEWADFDAYAAFRASPRLKIVGGPFNRREAFHQLCAIIGHWGLRGFGRWLVADKGTDAPLGVVGLYLPEGWPAPELAWSVFDAAEGKGIAAEAARAARAYAYDTLGWPSLMSAVHPSNARAVALAKRLGCTPDGTFEHPDYGHLQIWNHPAPQDLT
ncbi:GNAT family N-acetyltransferase [Yoonia sediminilitoris]|uniref:Ribosomal-protein-alanine N-acetyltransferase n=1 Tax=Yoonia sediminilitoris TaxID=1286148 RepID=A0A2T6K830_9RHOB|nr:GNAT family N-acetyltransferase [Yoonia sediminilitoris]PUB10881.1 ribosomal-protein-alanine N-acetyltransferase [Yoonia sediminilitoris]RCW90556.1 ribosomal-protein-alanine N-acetyltransferase [Yoonia sediminilitoris]